MVGLNRLKERLFKTRESLYGRLNHILRLSGRIDAAMLDSIEEILIGADIGVKTAHKILESVKQRLKRESVDVPDRLTSILREELDKFILYRSHEPLGKKVHLHKPYVILIVGVNGTGKTTTIGKLASRLVKEQKKVLLAAGDTFRAAASGQLEIWARRAKVDIVRQDEGADPAAVVFDAMSSAKARGYDVVLVDTAGRLHTKTNLMEELKKIDRVIKKQIPDAPHDTWLVLDATTGQNAIQQAKQFSQSVKITGFILTKLDGTAKGGVVLAIQQELNLPVVFIGIGEDIDDLIEFNPHDFIAAIVE
jgi:fused signal recognition particle receptor